MSFSRVTPLGRDLAGRFSRNLSIIALLLYVWWSLSSSYLSASVSLLACWCREHRGSDSLALGVCEIQQMLIPAHLLEEDGS